jgi:carboxymethylenebutenolidase
MDRIYVMELVQAVQTGKMSRREFTRRAALAVGSLASVNLLLAACQPITADRPPVVMETGAADAPATGLMEEDGLLTGVVEYPDTDDGTLMGYLARPSDGEPGPGVIVIQEWWGVDEHIKEVTRRFAQEGYVALAPDLYHGQVVSEPDEARKLVMELDMEQAVREIQQAISYLLEQAEVTGDQVGVVGFCMGGRLTLMTARAANNVGAAVAFYGTPLPPEDAQEIQAPVLGLYGEEDGGIPVENVEAMQEALDEAGIENSFTIYPGAQHAFFNDMRPSYDAEASADAWQQTLDWFSAHLGG